MQEITVIAEGDHEASIDVCFRGKVEAGPRV